MDNRRDERRRKRPYPNPEQDGGEKEPERKRAWQLFLESSGGTALITVLIGGIAASGVTSMIQNGAKDREFQNAWLKARGDQALVAYKDYLDQEQLNVRHAYELIGDCISAAQNMIVLTTPAFARGSRVGVEAEREDLIKKWNAVDGQWRRENEKLGLLMSYYHRGSPEVLSGWDETRDAVTQYMICARTWLLKYRDEPAPGEEFEAGVCQEEEKRYKESLKKLSVALDKNRQYAWEGWESPQTMKRQIEQAEREK